jgi:phosphoribosylanthranilate isomerase
MEPIMNTTRVKICGLTREQDLVAAVAAGADALGFVFAPGSKRLLDSPAAARLVRMAPAFVSRVGLFLNQEAEFVSRVLEQVPLNLLQFHGNEDGAYCRHFGLPYIKAVSGDSIREMERAQKEYKDSAGLLLDSHQPGGLGGTGKVFDWNKVGASRLPLILAGGLTVTNVRDAVCRVKPWAVDVSSGVEDAPGIKNASAMKRFIQEAKREY